MNTAKGHLFVRDRVGYRFRALVDRTLRERRHEERRLAEREVRVFWMGKIIVSPDGGFY